MVVGLFGLIASFISPLRAASHLVYVLPTTGIVDNVMAGYLADGIGRAERDGAAAVVIRLNTPGGSLQATSDIVSTLLESPVPTIVWVAPAGSRAASAGTFITLAAHVALMAPGTNIGAASPVGGQGEDIEGTLGEKVKNDAIANIRAIAEARGRNAEWAVSTVSEAKSSTATEAVDVGAVDGIAASIEEVLAFANGRIVTVANRELTLDLAGAAPEELGMNPFQAFLHLLSDPNIAFILFTLGFYGLLFELQSPNFVTGILGALAIILAFVGFGSLPLNVAGLLLIALAIVLFALEPTVTSHGLLTVAGLIAFVLGASALYTEPGDPTEPVVAVALPLILTMTGLTAAFMGIIAITAIRSRRLVPSPALVGSNAMQAGTAGEVRRPLAPIGSVYAGGEEWTARSVDERPLARGAPVRVVRQEGLMLVVEPAAPDEQAVSA
jgi:membrane-bound serine protease (ClpP class)